MSNQENYGDIVSQGVSNPPDPPMCQGECCNQCEDECCTWRTE